MAANGGAKKFLGEPRPPGLPVETPLLIKFLGNIFSYDVHLDNKENVLTLKIRNSLALTVFTLYWQSFLIVAGVVCTTGALEASKKLKGPSQKWGT